MSHRLNQHDVSTGCASHCRRLRLFFFSCVWCVSWAIAAAADTSTVAAKPQQTPPPTAGLINDWLRDQSPAATVWDVGGSGLYASTRKLVAWQDTDLFFLARNASPQAPNALDPGIPGTPSSARDIYTIGTRWKSVPGQLGPWDYAFEAAGQFGSINQGGMRRDHQAFAVNGTGGHTWKQAWAEPRVAAGYDFGSGDHSPTDGSNETFEPLFGTNHRLYGLMDLFGLRNMHIPRAGASIKPVKDLTVSLDWLGFWLVDTADSLYPESGPARNQNGYGRNPSFDSYVGSEIDLLANWRVASWGNLQAGYGHFFVGEYIRQSAANGARGTEDADWVYLQAIFNF